MFLESFDINDNVVFLKNILYLLVVCYLWGVKLFIFNRVWLNFKFKIYSFILSECLII